MAMLVNLHTHTPRCYHAVGSEREYIDTAIKSGLKVLGFSDHTPYLFPDDYYSHMRMYPEELAGYADTVRLLQTQYKGLIELPLGVEVEYYPALFPYLLPLLQDAGIEYMLLGQHWCGNEMGEEYNGRPTQSEEKLRRYCDQVIDAMQTGLFTYVAHPDILHFVGEKEIFKKHMRRLCREAKACGIPLEINLLGLSENRHYPHPLFWELAAEEGCSVVIGSDAHKPQHVVHPTHEKTALDMIHRLQLRHIERPQLRRI